MSKEIEENNEFEKWKSELAKYAYDEYGWTITAWEHFYWKEQFKNGSSPIEAIEEHVDGVTF